MGQAGHCGRHLTSDLRNVTDARRRVGANGPYWEKLFSAESTHLSIAKSEAEVLGSSQGLVVRRVFDIDSCILHLLQLNVFDGLEFWLSYYPPFSTSITQDLHVSVGGVEPHQRRNIQLGCFDNWRQNTVHCVFPHALKLGIDGTTTFTDELQQCWIDDYVLPALRWSCPAEVIQQHPTSFVHARSTAVAARAKLYVDAAAFRAHLRYVIPEEYVGGFWSALHRLCATGVVAEFRQPQLVFQAHNLKDHTSSDTAAGAWHKFSSRHLRRAVPGSISPDTAVVDLGFRDTVSVFGPEPFGRAAGITLAYRTHCLEHQLLKSAGNADRAPDLTGFTTRRWLAYMFRDLASFEACLHPATKPSSRGFGLSQIKAYNSHKALLYTPDKSGSPFSHPQLFTMCLSEDAMSQWYQSSSGKRAGGGFRGRDPLLRLFQGEKERMFYSLGEYAEDVSRYGSFGVRRECRLPCSIVANLDLDRLALGSGIRPLGREGHDPFYVVYTRDLNRAVLATTTRFVAALERLAVFTSPSKDPAAMSFDMVDQVEHVATSRVLTTLLALSSTSAHVERYPWIWKDRVNIRVRGSNKKTFGKGLGLHAAVQSTGMVWLPALSFDWDTPALCTTFRQRLYIPGIVRAGPTTRINARQKLKSVQKASMIVRKRRDMFAKLRALASSDPPLASRQRDKLFRICLCTVVRRYNRDFIESHRGFVDGTEDVPLKQSDINYILGQDRPIGPTTFATVLAMYVRLLCAVGPDNVQSRYNTEATSRARSHWSIPLPVVCEARRTLASCEFRLDPGLSIPGDPGPSNGAVPWGCYVTWVLSGVDGQALWASGKPFVRMWQEIQSEWQQVCEEIEGDLLHPADWIRYCQCFAGSLVHLTPAVDKSKFVYVQTMHSRAGQRGLYGIRYCAPGLSREPARRTVGDPGADISAYHFDRLLLYYGIIDILMGLGPNHEWLMIPVLKTICQEKRTKRPLKSRVYVTDGFLRKFTEYVDALHCDVATGHSFLAPIANPSTRDFRAREEWLASPRQVYLYSKQARVPLYGCWVMSNEASLTRLRIAYDTRSYAKESESIKDVKRYLKVAAYVNELGQVSRRTGYSPQDEEWDGCGAFSSDEGNVPLADGQPSSEDSTSGSSVSDDSDLDSWVSREDGDSY